MSLSFEIIFFCFIAFLLLTSYLLKDVFKILDRNNSVKEISEIGNEVKTVRIILIGVSILGLGIYFTFPFIENSGMESHLLEWLSLVVRWAHVILGIAWIGASFYFIFLENSLNRTKDLRDELAGNLWAIHGGGFYYVEKFKGAPAVIPEKLHWFKYEAYFTWLTGIILLTLVYYLNSKSFMIDSSVSDISSSTAIMIGIGSLISGWLIYDLMCRTTLLTKPKLFGLIGFIFLVILSFILSKFLSGRAAFIHVGALLGTIMAGNVFFTIIPSQKDLVQAAREKRPLNLGRAKIAGLRSLHNNYITLPVIFVMISNHFPGTFSPVYNWAILAGLTIGSVAVRHYINLYEREKADLKFLFIGAATLFALVFVTAPKPLEKNNAPVSFADVHPFFQKRCQSCHSSHPTDDVQKVAPNGVMFDTQEQIVKMKDRIMFRVVQTKTMPQGNKTGITEIERELIGRWIAQGASIQ
jgi:uncharacterized membrane protein